MEHTRRVPYENLAASAAERKREREREGESREINREGEGVQD